MFQKLVSRLSLSPSALSDLAFYARRLKQESVTRTFSAIAAVLIVALQFAVIAAPPAPTNAASSNDIIYGGIVSKADLLNHYDADAKLRALYNYFGITRADLNATKSTQVNSLDHSLMSLGRNQHASTDTKISIGDETYWARHLYEFDTGSNIKTGSYYNVLEGKRASDGSFFAVIFHCGNIVIKKLPPKPTPPPPPKPSPSPSPSPSPTPKASLACVKLDGDQHEGEVPLTVTFTGSGAASGQTITEYQFNFGDGTGKNQPGPTVSHDYTRAGPFTATLRVKSSKGTVTPVSSACSYTVTPTTPPAAFTKSKSALNQTQAVDATTKPALAKDTIRYTLTTKNIGGTAQDYTVVEHIEDILEYAEVTELGGAVITGGVMTWPAVTILPGKSLIKTFTVKIKNPIPPTPVGLSDKFSFDLRMDNVYGNDIRVPINPPLTKQVEGASTSMPDTGAGTSSLIVIAVASLVLYFYLRNRQLNAEVKLLRNQYQGAL